MRALTVKISGGSSVLVPMDFSLLTPYVLLEQEDWFHLLSLELREEINLWDQEEKHKIIYSRT